MPPLTYIHGFEAARTTAGGGTADGVSGRAVGGGKITPPTCCKWLNFNENGARVAGSWKARFCPAEGQGRAFCVCIRIVS